MTYVFFSLFEKGVISNAVELSERIRNFEKATRQSPLIREEFISSSRNGSLIAGREEVNREEIAAARGDHQFEM